MGRVSKPSARVFISKTHGCRICQNAASYRATQSRSYSVEFGPRHPRKVEAWSCACSSSGSLVPSVHMIGAFLCSEIPINSLYSGCIRLTHILFTTERILQLPLSQSFHSSLPKHATHHTVTVLFNQLKQIK